MKKIIIIFFILAAAVTGVNAQSVIQAEYFFDDNDNGYGACSPLSITSSADSTWDLTTDINVSGLSVGDHFLYIRMLDDNNQWGHTIRRFFQVVSAQAVDSVVSGEWFVDDQDLGYGQCANQFTVTNPDSDIVETLASQGAFSSLSYGNHKIYLRMKDTNQQWSHTLRRNVAVVPEEDSLFTYKVEFFQDADAGYDNCYDTIFPAFQQGCWTFMVPYTGTWTNQDTFFVRVQDSARYNWSHTVRVINQQSPFVTCNGITTEVSALISENGIVVYPNPAHDYLNIEFEDTPDHEFTITMFNVVGEIVLQEKVYDRSTRISLDKSPGIYFIRMDSGRSSVTKKIILE